MGKMIGGGALISGLSHCGAPFDHVVREVKVLRWSFPCQALPQPLLK